MKKLLIALPVIAGTSWAGTSYYAGVQSETAYQDLLSQIQFLEPITLTPESFKKGLTTSHAITAVRETNSPDADILFKLNHEINHSTVQLNDGEPAIGTATIRTVLVEDSVNANYADLLDSFTGNQPLEIVTKAGIGGHIASAITISPLELPLDGKEATLSIAGSTATLTSDGDRTLGEGVIGAITLLGESGDSLNSTPINVLVNTANQKPWLSPYEISYTLDALTSNSPDRPSATTLSDVQAQFASTLDNNELDYVGVFDVGQIDFGDELPAEYAPVNSGKLEIQLNNIKVQSVEDFVTHMSQYSLAVRTDPSQLPTAEILNQYAKVVTKNAEIMYDLELVNSAGKADADLTLRFIGDDSASGQDNLETGADLLNAIELIAHANIDKTALELTPAIAMMQTLPAQIAFVEQGDQYVAAVTVKKLMADLNGELFPLGQMFGEFLDVPIENLTDTLEGF